MKQLMLRLEALDSIFKHANAHTTENKSEARYVELWDSVTLEELWIGVKREQLQNILKYKMFDGSFSREILRSDETSSAELPDNFSKDDIQDIKNTYCLFGLRLKKEFDCIFDSMHNEIMSKIDSILKFLGKEISKHLDCHDIATIFKSCCYGFVVNEARKIAPNDGSHYDLETIIISLLSKEKLREAINGKAMITAFSCAIDRSIKEWSWRETEKSKAIKLLRENYIKSIN